jgi:hypothetical protein
MSGRGWNSRGYDVIYSVFEASVGIRECLNVLLGTGLFLFSFEKLFFNLNLYLL